MRLASFSGGTDINGCFALGNPIGPMCRGELQCRGLCMEEAALIAELADTIRKRIRNNTTPRHVPLKIISVADIPYAINMKKVELAVKSVIEVRPVSNLDALANPRSLELYRNLKELREEPHA